MPDQHFLMIDKPETAFSFDGTRKPGDSPNMWEFSGVLSMDAGGPQSEIDAWVDASGAITKFKVNGSEVAVTSFNFWVSMFNNWLVSDASSSEGVG